MLPLPFNFTWKIGTYALGVLLIASVTANALQKWTNSSLTEQLETSQTLLTTARNNVTILEAEVAAQNTEIDKLEAESNRRTEAAAKALAEAQKRTRIVEKRVAVLQDRPIEGSTLEARILSVDEMVLETIK